MQKCTHIYFANIVTDLSILPENVGANTCNTAILVGEKAAEIIARELGIIDYANGP